MILKEIGCATIKEYNRLIQTLPEVAGLSGDLKNFQRPWVADRIMHYTQPGSAILEIGADRCEVARFLQRKGYEVWVIDAYDSFGCGTGKFKIVRFKFPRLKIFKGFFHEDTKIPSDYFSSIYSCSVIEHIPQGKITLTNKRILECLKRGGFSIHAIDWTVEGSLLKNQPQIEEMLKYYRSEVDVSHLREQALNDIDTYLLSPQGHYNWRKYLQKSYDEYPFRKVTSLNLVAQKE